MKWSLMELKRYKDTGVSFEEEFDLRDELLERSKDILDVTKVSAKGTLLVSPADYIVQMKIEAQLVLPSARSLLPVDVTLPIDVTEIYMTKAQYEERNPLIPDEDIIILDKDLIDLREAVCDHILLNIPLQVFTDEELRENNLPKGEEWEVLSQEEYENRRTQESPKVDPRLAKLAELFPDEEQP